MRKINIAVTSLNTDTAAVMAAIGSRMGSINVGRMEWGRVLTAARMQNLPYSQPKEVGNFFASLPDELFTLAVKAVPEEGDPHPQRAILTPEGDGLITPGGVTVRFTMTNILIDFGRDSTFLAASILAGLGEVRGELKLFAMAGAVASEIGPESAHLIF